MPCSHNGKAYCSVEREHCARASSEFRQPSPAPRALQHWKCLRHHARWPKPCVESGTWRASRTPSRYRLRQGAPLSERLEDRDAYNRQVNTKARPMNVGICLLWTVVQSEILRAAVTQMFVERTSSQSHALSQHAARPCFQFQSRYCVAQLALSCICFQLQRTGPITELSGPVSAEDAIFHSKKNFYCVLWHLSPYSPPSRLGKGLQ